MHKLWPLFEKGPNKNPWNISLPEHRPTTLVNSIHTLSSWCFRNQCHCQRWKYNDSLFFFLGHVGLGWSLWIMESSIVTINCDKVHQVVILVAVTHHSTRHMVTLFYFYLQGPPGSSLFLLAETKVNTSFSYWRTMSMLLLLFHNRVTVIVQKLFVVHSIEDICGSDKEVTNPKMPQ